MSTEDCAGLSLKILGETVNLQSNFTQLIKWDAEDTFGKEIILAVPMSMLQR